MRGVAVVAVLLASAAACGRLSGGGGGTFPFAADEPLIPASGASAPQGLSLVSLVGGDGAVLAAWINDPDATVVVFQSTSLATLFDGPPTAVPPGDTRLVLGGLANGLESFVSLGIDTTADGGPFEPVGVVLSATPGPPIYVDPAADPATATGEKPEEAFPLLTQGILTAFTQPRGGNIWLVEGDYVAPTVQTFPGSRIYGGFAPGFQLDQRDPDAHPSRILGDPGKTVFKVPFGVGAVVLDGLHIDGGGAATVAVDVNETAATLRSLRIEAMASTGVRLGGPSAGDPAVADVIGCSISGSGAEGLSLKGAVDLTVQSSAFESNVQEGIDLDDLVAPDGRTVHLLLRDVRCFGNGAEGLDVDMLHPAGGGAVGGRFELELVDCTFELNGTVGARLDIDFESEPLWSADIVMRGCIARANLSCGILLDVDGPAAVFLHRVLSIGNAGDGLLITSESSPGVATVSASALVGNLGAGLRAQLGNVAPLVTHGIVAGNAGGGIVSSSVTGTAASTVFSLQDAPRSGVQDHFSVVHDDPFTDCFQVAPFYYGSASEIRDDEVSVAFPLPPLGGTELIELSDDSVQRLIAGLTGDGFIVAPPPEFGVTPALVSLFRASKGTVIEDYRPASGSVAKDAGMVPPGHPPVDAGPFGTSLPGAPGLEDAVLAPLFRASSVDPPPSQPLGNLDSVTVEFLGGSPSPASVNVDSVVARTASGTVLATNAFVQDGLLVVDPPPAGWGAETVLLELHAGLQSTDFVPIATPLAIPLPP